MSSPRKYVEWKYFHKPRREANEPPQRALSLPTLSQLLFLPSCPSYSLSSSFCPCLSLSFSSHPPPLHFPIVCLNLRNTIQGRLWPMRFVGNYVCYSKQKSSKRTVRILTPSQFQMCKIKKNKGSNFETLSS